MNSNTMTRLAEEMGWERVATAYKKGGSETNWMAWTTNGRLLPPSDGEWHLTPAGAWEWVTAQQGIDLSHGCEGWQVDILDECVSGVHATPIAAAEAAIETKMAKAGASSG